MRGVISGSTARKNIIIYLDNNNITAVMARPMHPLHSYTLHDRNDLTKSRFINNTRIQIEKDVDYNSVKLLNLTSV